MKTTFKFIVAAFVLAFSIGAFTSLQAQNKTSASVEDAYPGPSIEVYIKGKQRTQSIFDLTAFTRSRTNFDGADRAPAFFMWLKDDQVIGFSQMCRGVSFGTYTVIVRETNSHLWGMATITLTRRQTLTLGETTDM